MIPFQFSAHRVDADGATLHRAFLDLSGEDPSRAFAEALVGACTGQGPVFVYNAGFETARIADLAQRFPELAAQLLSIKARVADLLPIARKRYYHPGQQGSWSIKRVLPAIAPELCYEQLDGVQDGGGAMAAYLEAIAPGTGAARKRRLAEQLLEYCRLDALAMLRLWEFFRGAAPPTPDGIGERILQNPELVRRILEWDAHTGKAQTAPEFLAWLASVNDEPVEPD